VESEKWKVESGNIKQLNNNIHKLQGERGGFAPKKITIYFLTTN